MKRKTISKTGRNSSVKQAAFYPIPRTARVGALLLCAAVGAAIQWLCYEDVRAVPVTFAVAFILYRGWKRSVLDTKKQEFEKRFGEFLSALYSGMMAGYSLENAIRSAGADLEGLYGKKELLVQRLRDLIREMDLQRAPGELLTRLGVESGSEDIRNLGEVLSITQKTGGSPDQTLAVCRTTILERMDTRAEISTVIAGKVFEQRIMSLVPAGILFYLRLSFGGFLDCLYGNVLGAGVMTVCLMIYLAAILLGERIVRVSI